jgi:hypothetical protein
LARKRTTRQLVKVHIRVHLPGHPPHVRDFIVAPPDGELAGNGLPSR